MATMTTSLNALVRQAGIGVAGGIVGGIAFGIMMGMMDMLPMVAALVGASDAVVGFIVHLGISAIIGAIYGVVSSRLPQAWTPQLIAGVANGVIWWVLGALILMPLMLGMNQMVFVIEQMQIMSLIGHVIFGVVAAVVVKVLKERAV